MKRTESRSIDSPAPLPLKYTECRQEPPVEDTDRTLTIDVLLYFFSSFSVACNALFKRPTSVARGEDRELRRKTPKSEKANPYWAADESLTDLVDYIL